MPEIIKLAPNESESEDLAVHDLPVAELAEQEHSDAAHAMPQPRMDLNFDFESDLYDGDPQHQLPSLASAGLEGIGGEDTAGHVEPLLEPDWEQRVLDAEADAPEQPRAAALLLEHKPVPAPQLAPATAPEPAPEPAPGSDATEPPVDVPPDALAPAAIHKTMNGVA
jgi:hypothetical protein